ncbi:MAG: exo-alpha-sialidase [Phycisphaerales bacterium]|nr:exo-alpha-sialidase [Phycisphaerales bacterium]
MLATSTPRRDLRAGDGWMTAWLAVAIVTAFATTALAGDAIVGPQVRVNTVGGTAGANETTVSGEDANPTEIIAGWNNYLFAGGVRSGFALSQDSGRTWNGFILRPAPGDQCGTEGDPMTAVDPRTGTMWAGAIAFCGAGGLYVAKKDPGATQFEAAVMADSGAGIDKGWMAAGPRFGQPDTTRVFCVYNLGIIWSDDLGQTWTNPMSLGAGIGFLPRVGPNGEIYVAYWDFGVGVRLKRSLNDGASFTTHTIATRMDVWGTQDGSRFPGTFRVPLLSYLDVDPITGTLHAAYFDTTGFDGQGNAIVDVYYTRSFDLGSSWETPRVINAAEPSGDQFFTWIEVDTSGRVHLVYFDSRHTSQMDGVTNGMFDAYYAVSQDGGDTFTEHRLTPDSWNSADDGIAGSDQFIGDYLGLSAADDRVYPVYIDTSNGSSELYTNVITFAGTCPQDFDGDGTVGFLDLLTLLGAWGECPPSCPWDIDGSGDVGILDLLSLLSAWGVCS